MIQRIQTIFLVLVPVLFVILLFVPVYMEMNTPHTLSTIPLLMAPLALAAIVALIAVFMYKNRKQQLKVCTAGIILSLLLAVNAIIFPQFFLHVPREQLSPAIGSWLLLLNIVFFFLARYNIKKDEALVKAADRLR